MGKTIRLEWTIKDDVCESAVEEVLTDHLDKNGWLEEELI